MAAQVAIVCFLLVAASTDIHSSPTYDESEPTTTETTATDNVSESATIQTTANPTATNADITVMVVIAGVLLGLLTLVLIPAIAYLGVRAYQEQILKEIATEAGLEEYLKGDDSKINAGLPVAAQIEFLPYDTNGEFEFPRHKLRLGEVIGSGHYGVVMKALACGIVEGKLYSNVAVRTVKKEPRPNPDHLKVLASELKILSHLGKHVNIVNLLGACTQDLNKLELIVIVEYCRNGKLANYLRNRRHVFIDTFRSKLPAKPYRYDSSGLPYAADPVLDGEEELMDSSSASQSQDPKVQSDQERETSGSHLYELLSSNDLVQYAFQVASGMEYLSSRKIVHGDLAAQNILLCKNNIVKICYYGFDQGGAHLFKENEDLPLQWFAIESLNNRKLTTQSDIWSFGIVVWEIFSLAKQPYAGIQDWQSKLHTGYRMEKPAYANDEVYSMMRNCWNVQPEMRPSFRELAARLRLLLNVTSRKHYDTINDRYREINRKWRSQPGHIDYFAILPHHPKLVPARNVSNQTNISVPDSAISTIPGHLPATLPKEPSITGGSPTTPVSAELKSADCGASENSEQSHAEKCV